MIVPQLGDPVFFYQTRFRNEWWTSAIQSYAQCRMALKGEGLQYGPAKTRDLIDYIPSVPLSVAEHFKDATLRTKRILEKRALVQKGTDAFARGRSS